ncbi:MAG: sodium:calcium antiporter [Myxococcales bacterium]|nr:sodium:calcium antiporter [Myxococcales bacterium]
MEFATNFGLVTLGGLILYLGAEWLVKGAAGLAKTFGIREIVIGLTVIAYGTSAPELAVSVSANLKGSSPLVFGNVIGSCIANLGLILGITALIAPPKVDSSLTRRDVPVLVLSVIILPVMLINFGVTRVEAAFLLGLAVAYSLMTLASSKSELAQSAADLESTAEAGGAPAGEGGWRLLGITLVGLGLLVGGGELFVSGAKGIALDLGMSDRLVGLTIVAFGTSLPELAASLVAALRGHSGLAIGNVVGSNIFNIFLVVGASGSIRALPGDITKLTLDVGFLIGLTVFAAVAMRTERTVTRLEGCVLLMAYVTFLVLAIAGL